MTNNLDGLSGIMSLAGCAVGAMAGISAYALAVQKQAFRVNLIAGIIFGALIEVALYTFSFYREFPEIGRFTLGVRNVLAGFATVDAYLGMMSVLGTAFVGIQNNFAANAAALSGIMIAQLSSHIFTYIRR